MRRRLPRVKRRNPWDQWTTTCPACKRDDTLVVSEVIHVASGRKLYPGTKLCPDGFEFEPGEGWKDASTTNEKIVCVACEASFGLSDLALPPQ